jgi:hypothetical protein
MKIKHCILSIYSLVCVIQGGICGFPQKAAASSIINIATSASPNMFFPGTLLIPSSTASGSYLAYYMAGGRSCSALMTSVFNINCYYSSNRNPVEIPLFESLPNFTASWSALIATAPLTRSTEAQVLPINRPNLQQQQFSILPRVFLTENVAANGKPSVTLTAFYYNPAFFSTISCIPPNWGGPTSNDPDKANRCPGIPEGGNWQDIYIQNGGLVAVSMSGIDNDYANSNITLGENWVPTTDFAAQLQASETVQNAMNAFASPEQKAMNIFHHITTAPTPPPITTKTYSCEFQPEDASSQTTCATITVHTTTTTP